MAWYWSNCEEAKGLISPILLRIDAKGRKFNVNYIISSFKGQNG